MDKERNEMSFFTDVLHTFAIIFTFAFITLTFVFLLITRFSPDVQDVSTKFTYDSIGISFATIFQIICFSFIIAVIKALLFSDWILVKMKLTWRACLLLFGTLITFSIFAILFKWFTIDDPLVWAGFIISTIVCFSISFGLTLLKLKLEGKRYEKLLANYKANRNRI